MVPLSRLALFYDAGEYNLLPSKPVSKSTESETALEYLLDKNKTTAIEFKGFLFQQIPFLQNDEDAFYASYSIGEIGTAESATHVKKFLIQRSGLSYEDEKLYVVTMITDKTYFDTHPDFDFFSRPNYTGLVVFSSLEGEFMNANVYLNGYIRPVLRIKDIGQAKDKEVFYVSSFSSATTKQGGGTITGWDGSPGYCWDYANAYVLNPSYCIGNFLSGGHGGGGGNPWGQWWDLNAPNLYYDLTLILPDIAPEEIKYTVRVSTNCPKDIKMVLDGYGQQFWDPYSSESGTNSSDETVREYLIGSYASVYPEYVSYTEHEVNIEDFSHWTGYFRDMDTDDFAFIVSSDIASTAYYGNDFPCYDDSLGVSNPLFNMSVASSASWGNYKGGTYGKTRIGPNGKSKYHGGLDLSADLGTPVFALYPGIVIQAYSSAPDHYVPQSFGNVLLIESYNKAGQTFIVQYAHLNYGTPFATNHFTGQPYAVGDIVYPGDLIGYSGRTGNAYNVQNYHLHLGIKVDGSWVDPVDFINGDIDVATINKTQGRIDNIKCD